MQKIDPKDIEKVFVRKSGGEDFIEVIKKDSSIIKIFNSEKGIPNIDKKVTTAKMPTVKNNITLKNGYSIYTDKNGVEHKIISSEIDKVYITNNKNGEFDLSKSPKTITSLKVNNINSDDVNITILPKNGYSVEYKFTESNESLSKQLDKKRTELKLDEQNTKKQIKEIEILQKGERKKNKS